MWINVRWESRFVHHLIPQQCPWWTTSKALGCSWSSLSPHGKGSTCTHFFVQPHLLLAWHPVVSKNSCHEVQLAFPIGHPLQKITQFNRNHEPKIKQSSVEQRGTGISTGMETHWECSPTWTRAPTCVSNNNCFLSYLCGAQCLGRFSNKDNIPDIMSILPSKTNKSRPYYADTQMIQE